MLIIPVFTTSDQKKLPLVCLSLIVINCLIFFLLQAKDTKIENEAYSYYEKSGLLVIEATAYQAYLADRADPAADLDLQRQDERYRLVRLMFSDHHFLELLESNKIISPTDPPYAEWRPKRDTFTATLAQSSTHKYGYSPRDRNTTGLLTGTFLHGGLMHLVGNMVFLYLVGAILEVAIGPAAFLALYLVTGVCASALFGIIYPTNPGPLIGASGAISGLMGAYGVIFGLRRIRVFYSVGFYFNYARVPALTLFPIWLLNEFFQLYTNENSNVAYIAHIGGLFSGIIIGSGYKALLRARIDSLFVRAEQKQTAESYLESGQKKLGELDFKNARMDFLQVLNVEPGNLQAIRKLYVIDKSSPESEEFHESTKRLLDKLKTTAPEGYLETYEDYAATSKHPRLTLDMLEQLSFLYLSRKHYLKAAPVISALLKKNPASSNLPGYLLKLADGLMEHHKVKPAHSCYQVLAKRFPATSEGRAAQGKLSRLEHTPSTPR
ncbi:MAG: rhomboid family intramembrane serine protease [Desulfofustis sp.]|nr:rhomboid family intramembrane serine protease [Desulfofustis sp.]